MKSKLKLHKGDRYCTEFHIREALTMYLNTMNLIADNETVTSVSPDTSGDVYKFKVEKN